MKCNNCGKEIVTVKCVTCNTIGQETTTEYRIIELEKNKVFSFTTGNEFFPGYELDEEELVNCINCPNCDEYPFSDNEIHTYERLDVVCFNK